MYGRVDCSAPALLTCREGQRCVRVGTVKIQKRAAVIRRQPRYDEVLLRATVRQTLGTLGISWPELVQRGERVLLTSPGQNQEPRKRNRGMHNHRRVKVDAYVRLLTLTPAVPAHAGGSAPEGHKHY